MPPYPGFVGPSYISQSILTDYEECINWYPEQNGSPYAKSKNSLYPTPGFESQGDMGVVGARCLETMNNFTLAVMGNQVGGINKNTTTGALTFVPYGTVATDSNPAQITFNGLLGDQALIASGGQGYCLDLGTKVLTPVLSFASGDVVQVGMLDGFGLAFGNGRMYVSAINDFTSWDPTQFLQRSDNPDFWESMYVLPPDIFMCGEYSGCVLYDSGAFPFPFAIRPGSNFRYGIDGPFSMKGTNYTVLWLAQNHEGGGFVVRTRGYQVVRISTYAMEQEIAQYTATTDAESFIYQNRGHTFYVLQFPTQQKTWVYDIELNLWHKRGYWNPSLNRYDRWMPRVHTRNFGEHLVGEWNSSLISQMDELIPTERDGTAIRRLRRAPGFFAERRTLPIQSIDLYLESGTSNALPPGDDAVIMWRTSDDGGRTWTMERQEPIGRIGDYSAFVRMWGMGIVRDRVNELVVSDPITSWRITDCFLNNHAPSGGG